MKQKTYKFRIYPNRKQETAINILNKVGQPELTCGDVPVCEAGSPTREGGVVHVLQYTLFIGYKKG